MRFRGWSRLSAIVALLLPLVSSPAPAQQPDLKVLRRFAVGGEGGWDYLTVDTAKNRLFVSRGTHVMVVGLDSGTVLGDIPNTNGVHGIALAYDLGKGFTSNGRDSTVTIFDLATLAVQGTVNVGGANPDAITYDPATRRVFTMNGRSGTASAIDAATGRLIGTVALGGRPEEVVADGHGRLFINLEDSSRIVEVDARRLTVGKRWSILPCEGPSGLAMDRAHQRLFSVCDGHMAVSDAGRGRVVADVPIGHGPDGAAFDASTGDAYASCGGDSVLSIVHEAAPGRFAAAGGVVTQRGARTIALDERTHRLYLPAAQFEAAPAPQPGQPRQRPRMVPGSFVILEVGK